MEENLKEEHIRNAEESLRRGRANLSSDPRTGFFQLSTGLGLLAWAYSDSEIEKSIGYLVDIVDLALACHKEYDLPIAAQRHNDFMFFASSAGKIEKARSVAAVNPTIVNSHAFDVLLNYHLRRVLGQKLSQASVKYSATMTEELLFKELEVLTTRPHESTLEGLDAYWRATRNKRYAHTIFQRINLFSMAGKNIRAASNQAL